MFEEILDKIKEERDNTIAQAFTRDIGSLLISNGIVPVMTDYSANEIQCIISKDKFKLIMEYGIVFDELDTSKHDAKIREDTIEEVLKTIADLAELDEEENRQFRKEILGKLKRK